LTDTLTGEFFDGYARSRSVLDIELIASQYSDSFMLAGPNGVRVVQKVDVLAAFPKGEAFLKGLGHKSTELMSLDESLLDDHYVMARARFVWHFEKAPSPPIEVEVNATFILYMNQGALTIVFQHEHEDFQDALRTQGLLPP
jgi:hypothetical protein